MTAVLFVLGCAGGSSTNRGGSGGTAGSGGSAQGGKGGTTSTGDASSGGASTGPRGGSSTAGHGGSSSATSSGGNSGGASSEGTGGTKSTGGTPGSSGGVGGSGGSLGGRSETSGQDAGPEVQPARDALPDLATDRPAGDAASMPGTHNPVLPGVFADPNIIIFDDTFYIYPTTDGFPNWGATSFSVFTSKDLVQWTNQGVILDVVKDTTWGKGRAWAPGIARVGDTYYFYFSAETQIGVATSKSPTGPFKDALGAPLIKAGQYGTQVIDPYVFLDDDGTPYLLFGSGGGGLRMGKLNADMISFADTPSNIKLSGTSGTLEGSGMFKRKGSYYLYWSEGDTREASYRMAYAQASALAGPFARAATIVEQNPSLKILGSGGGTVLAIPARDEFYLAYHRYKIPGGDGTNRETCIDRMVFNSDGSIAPVKPTLEGLQAAVQP